MFSQNSKSPGTSTKRRAKRMFAAMVASGALIFSTGDIVAQQPVQQGNQGQMMDPGMMQMPGEAQGPNLPRPWVDDMGEAKEKAQESDKPILAMFSASWSTPCQMMIQEVFPDPEVVSELEDWVPVYIDGEAHGELVTEHEVENFPTYVVLTSTGEEKGRFVGGAANANGFLMRLDAAVDYEEKLAAARDAVDETPDNPRALHRLGDLKMAAVEDNEGFMKAVDIYKKALTENPQQTGNIEPGLAMVLVESVEKDREVAAVTRQIEQSPEDPTLYKRRADLRTEDPLALDSSKAIEDYRKAASLDPDNQTGAAGALAFHEIRDSFSNGQSEPAQLGAQLEEFESAHPESDRVPESMLLRAYVELQGGQFDRGAAILNDLVENHPADENAETARQLLSEIAAQMQQQQMMQQQQQQGQQQQEQPQPLPLQ